MKNKKILALALGGLLLLTAACSQNGGTANEDEKSEAFATYTSTFGRLNAEPGSEDAQFDMDIEMIMNMKIMGQDMPINMSGNIKSVVEDGKVLYSALMETGIMGMTNTTEMLYDGEKFLYLIDGVENEIDMTMFEEQMQNPFNMPEFSLDAVKSCETTDVPDGKKTTFIIDGGKMTDYMMDTLAESADMLGGLVADMSMEDMAIEFVVDGDGNPKSMNMQMNMSMDAEGQAMETDMSMKITVNKFGSGVEVDTSKLQAA